MQARMTEGPPKTKTIPAMTLMMHNIETPLKVLAMNAELADSQSSIGAALKATFVNDDNEDNILAPLVKITSANYTSTETEVIYDGQ